MLLVSVSKRTLAGSRVIFTLEKKHDMATREVGGQRSKGFVWSKGGGGSSRFGLGQVSRSCTCPFFFFNFNDSYR